MPLKFRKLTSSSSLDADGRAAGNAEDNDGEDVDS